MTKMAMAQAMKAEATATELKTAPLTMELTVELTMDRLRELNRKGFTLIEVLVSVLIFSVTAIILAQSWAGSRMAVRKGRTYNTVTLLLQKKVVEFETQNKDKKIDELKEEEHGDFGSAFPDFKWQIKTRPFEMPPVPFPKSNNAQQNQIAETISKTMATYFEKAVREVLVTISYTRNGKTLNYAVTTLFVDYGQELPNAF